MFLKKTKTQTGIYLALVESYYDPHLKKSRHRTVEKIGFVHTLQAQGMKDPIAHYTDVAKKRTQEQKARKARVKEEALIGDAPATHNMGQYLIRAVARALNLTFSFNLLGKQHLGNRVYLGDIIEDLTLARLVDPSSKRHTYKAVLPRLKSDISYSQDDVYHALEVMGQEYRRLVAWIRDESDRLVGLNRATTYFDCTNFYFEIDREDDFRKKGPSKERQVSPLVGMGLLLDLNLIPINMILYPGNESEKPKLKEILKEIKEEAEVAGRTIRVADKGLNCAANIIDALQIGDGYIFSRSIKGSAERERRWILSERGFKDHIDQATGEVIGKIKWVTDTFSYKDPITKQTISVKEKRVVSLNSALRNKQLQEIDKHVDKAKRLMRSYAKQAAFGDAERFVTFVSEDDGTQPIAVLNQEAIDKARMCAGYNMIVTSETHMSAHEIYAAYHQLWRIEESFRTLKTYLDARPVYLQKENRIKGHFFICYYALVLLRILQFHYLNSEFGTAQIIEFIRSFEVVDVTARTYKNLGKLTDVGSYLHENTNLLVNKAVLRSSEIKAIQELKFKPKKSH